MNKITAVIPVLLGSTRIPNKNLLLVNGFPMAFYVAKACKAAGVFDEIYISSEDEIFRMYAEQLGVNFHKRPASRGGSACEMQSKSRQCIGDRCQVHDHFLTDFMEAVPSEYCVQVHATSPLIKAETVRGFCEKMTAGSFDSFFAVEELYNECFLDDRPINFSFSKKTMTQALKPVRRLSWAITGWKSESFLASYRRDDPAEDGPTYCGKLGMYPISHIEALDADTLDELFIIEACLSHEKRRGVFAKFKFADDVVEIDNDLERLIRRDGVDFFSSSDDYNQLHMRVQDIKAKMEGDSWCHPVVYTDNDQCFLIAQAPGEGCRKHYHATKGEWWMVIEGVFEWKTGEGRVIVANPGEIVHMPHGMVHTITCVGDKPGIRLACGGRDMEHVYVRP